MSCRSEFNITPHIQPTDKMLDGMPLEVTGFDNDTYPRWVRGTKLFWGKRARISVEGDLPEDGPILFIATHTGTESTALLPHVVTRVVNRPVQMVAKHTLLDPTQVESEKVQKRTGKVDHGKPSLKDKFFSNAAIASNSIPFVRGERNKERYEDVHTIFEKGHAIGWFIQETRSKQDNLTDTRPGAALAAIENPDVPIVLVSIARTKFAKVLPSRSPSVRLRSLGSYHDIAGDQDLGLKTLTNIFTTNLGQMLLEDVPEITLSDEVVMHKVNGEVIVDFAKEKPTG